MFSIDFACYDVCYHCNTWETGKANVMRLSEHTDTGQSLNHHITTLSMPAGSTLQWDAGCARQHLFTSWLLAVIQLTSKENQQINPTCCNTHIHMHCFVLTRILFRAHCQSVLPVFLYGSDCWAISKTDAHKIDALNQWCLRMLFGIKWYQFVRNDDVRRITKQTKLTAIIQSHRLTLFWHIMRMDDNADAKRILLASPPAEWRRQPGRPRITWLSTVQQDLKQHHFTLPEAADLAQNRPLWRMMSTYGATQS